MTSEKRANNFDDKTGRRYGRLTVLNLSRIETLSNGKKRSMWFCKCDCGKECTIRCSNLTCGITKSCGCIALEKMNDFIQNHVKKAPGIRCRNSVFNSYKTSSKARGLDFELTIEDFVNLTNKNCHYCNEEPSAIKKSEYGNGDFVYNGIDRVDNDVGYVLSNCETCCYTCNFMKVTLSKEDFINKAMLIAKHWKDKI